jgi:hypothetical protein
MNAVVTCLLPSIATVGVVSTIQDILVNSTKSSVPKSTTVSVHKDHFDLLNTILTHEQIQNVTLVLDPTMPEHSAWITATEDETSVDFDTAVDAAKTALSAYLQFDFKDIEHG